MNSLNKKIWSFENENKELRILVAEGKANLKSTQLNPKLRNNHQKDKNLENISSIILPNSQLPQNQAFNAIEVMSLDEEKKRLICLLKKTSEFKSFSNFADHFGNLSFLNSLKHSFCEKSYPPYLQPCCSLNETRFWVPSEAYTFAHNFKSQSKGELSPESIDNLLYELNRIWSEKINHYTRKTMASCSSKANLKTTQNFMEKELNDKIKTLQEQLRIAYKENIEHFSKKGIP